MAFAGFGAQLGSLIEAVNIVGSLFYGSMLGAFVLAFGPWRANGNGAFAGMNLHAGYRRHETTKMGYLQAEETA